jgi:hypothetical protein
MALGTVYQQRTLRTLERRIREAYLVRLRADRRVRDYTIPGAPQGGREEAYEAYLQADKAYNELRQDLINEAGKTFAAGGATAVCIVALLAPTP